MADQHTYEEKGKVQPKPEHEGEIPQKVQGPVTVSDMEGKLNAETLTRMQQTVGNAAVQRFLAQRSAEGQSEIDDETTASINAKRGGGQSLDENISSKAGEAMGHDFSDVSVHTDSGADQLNKQLGAKAFTTGSDIFFKEGAYSPGSSEGQSLISHELTHVVQQSGNTAPGQGKMTVNDPNDQYESEADAVADSVLNSPEEDAVQREASESLLMRSTWEEEEGEDIVAPGEEEELMAKPDDGIQLQEEDERDPNLARPPIPTEEDEI